MIGEATTAMFTVNYGAGRHIWDVQLEKFIAQLYVRLLKLRSQATSLILHPVDQYCWCCLCPHRCPHQDRHTSTIQASLRPKSTECYGHVRNPLQHYIRHHPFLHPNDRLQCYRVHSSTSHLGPFCTECLLLQPRRHLPSHRRLQRRLRLHDPDHAHPSNLETANEALKEGRRDSPLCNRAIVS